MWCGGAKAGAGNGAGKQGKVLAMDFTIEGRAFKALNGGPHFKFNEAVSFFVECKDQAEVDMFWDKLTADGGAPRDAAGSRTSSACRGRSCRSS